jgi:hypothetical protein
MKKVYLRDEKGRFAKVPGIRRYNAADLEKAWLAGYNGAFGVLTSPARRLLNYKQENGII